MKYEDIDTEEKLRGIKDCGSIKILIIHIKYSKMIIIKKKNKVMFIEVWHNYFYLKNG